MDKESLSYILRKIAPASGIIALVILSFFVSWKDVWIRFKEVNRLYLILSTLFNITFIVAETLRLKWVLGYPKLEKLLRVFSLSRLIGIGTVHLAGEGALVAGLKLSDVSLKSAASAILYLRCLDLGVLCLVVGLYGATYFNLSVSFPDSPFDPSRAWDKGSKPDCTFFFIRYFSRTNACIFMGGVHSSIYSLAKPGLYNGLDF